jgi:hypothetical protein
MGLISGLLTLPLLPVRGTVALAQRIEEQAYAELYDESAIREGFATLEAARAIGEIDDDELAEAENAVVERLMALRGFQEAGDDGRER